MVLKKLDHDLTVCKLSDLKDMDQNMAFYFLGRTDEEISLVCKTEDTPKETVAREDGWRAFRVQGELDLSLTGILSAIAGLLAEHKISIFAVSTYNTDYVLVKKENFARAMEVLSRAGYVVE